MAYLTTITGQHVDYLKPAVDQIRIEDIAYGLSHECRYNGQIRQFYSVAEHSYHASFIVPREYALEALLHDATEAYLKDIPSPLKSLLNDYKVLEEQFDQVIRKRFSLPAECSPEVKYADHMLFRAEVKHFMKIDAWGDIAGEPDYVLNPLQVQPCDVRGLFMHRYWELVK